MGPSSELGVAIPFLLDEFSSGLNSCSDKSLSGVSGIEPNELRNFLIGDSEEHGSEERRFTEVKSGKNNTFGLFKLL